MHPLASHCTVFGKPGAASPAPASLRKSTDTLPRPFGANTSVRLTGGLTATTAVTGALLQVGTDEPIVEQVAENASPTNVSVPNGSPSSARTDGCPGVTLNKRVTVPLRP